MAEEVAWASVGGVGAVPAEALSDPLAAAPGSEEATEEAGGAESFLTLSTG